MTIATDVPRAAIGGSDESADVAFCVQLLPQVSRTFALSIEGLPATLREPVRVAYLLCRIVDTIEDDHEIPWDERVALFDAFDDAMGDDASDVTRLCRLARANGIGDGAEIELSAQADRVFRRFRAQPPEQREAIRPHILEMSRGMREYTARAEEARQLRLASLDDLERYCYFVAGTVGELLTDLFELEVMDLTAPQHEAIHETAVSFGLGLQLVNIVKDIASDFPKGDCYLPKDLCQQHGFDLDRVLAPEQRREGLAVVRAVCARARSHLQRAARYTQSWPLPAGRAIRMFCVMPLALAFTTLWEVEHGDATLLAGAEPKVRRQTVYRLVADASAAIEDDGALESFLERCEEGCYGASPRSEAGAPMSVTRPANDAAAPGGEPRSLKAGDGRFSGRVLVTGASGHLGANLVRRLLALGYPVRALLRPGADTTAVEGLDLEVVTGDLRDRKTLEAASEDCETVFHCAAKVSTIFGNRQHQREIFETNVLGTRNMLEAARATGVLRTVVTGSFSAVGFDLDDPSRPASEDRPVYPFRRTLPYERSKVLVEHEVLKAVAEGQDALVATSCAIVGPHDYKPSRMGQTLIKFAHGKLPAYVPGGFEFVAARDIVEGHVLAMHRGRTGQKYTIATEFVTFDRLMEIFEEVTGRRRPRLKVPSHLMGAIAEVSSFVLSNFFPQVDQLITPGAVEILRMRRHADTSKARQELGFEPSSVRRAIHDAYEDFARRGLVPASPTSRPAPFRRTPSPQETP